MLALTAAAPAWSNPSASATATLAPIGAGSHLLTITNTGSSPITGFVVSAGSEPVPINIVPSPACQFGNTPFTGSIRCTVTVPPGASTQMCYTGHALTELVAGSALLVQTTAGENFAPVGTAPAAASCPLQGFNAGSGTSGKGAHPWSHAMCKSTYRSWTHKHLHATRTQKKAEANKLHKTHGCPLSILK